MNERITDNSYIYKYT